MRNEIIEVILYSPIRYIPVRIDDWSKVLNMESRGAIAWEFSGLFEVEDDLSF